MTAMRVYKIGLLLSSQMLAAGLREMLHRAHGITVIDLSEGAIAETYTQRISTESPSLVIVDPFTSCYCPETMRSILLVSSQVPGSVSEGHVATLSIYDDSKSILEKIKSVVEPTVSGDQRGNDLSPRERDVIMHIVKGMSNKEIAAEMNVSVNTVMTHRRNIASKLEIHSPAGLTIFAIATGMVKIEDVPL